MRSFDSLKKLASIVLLGLFLYHVTGVFILFNIQHSLIREASREKIEEAMEEGELETLILTEEEATEIEWLDENEFRFQGQIYDVVEYTHTSEGTLIYRCFNDTEDQTLYEELDKELKAVSESSDNEENGPEAGIRWDDFFCGSDSKTSSETRLVEISRDKIYTPNLLANSLNLAPAGPPPKFKSV